MSVGERIKIYLDDHGIRTSFLSEKTGIRIRNLYQITSGKRNISVEEYFLVCKALDLPFDYFYEE